MNGKMRRPAAPERNADTAESVPRYDFSGSPGSTGQSPAGMPVTACERRRKLLNAGGTAEARLSSRVSGRKGYFFAQKRQKIQEEAT